MVVSIKYSSGIHLAVHILFSLRLAHMVPVPKGKYKGKENYTKNRPVLNWYQPAHAQKEKKK